MKFLLPLARANTSACVRLATKMAGQHWSAREVEAVYVGWRKAKGEQRAAIEASPRLYCQAREAVVEPLPVDDPKQRCPDITLAKNVLGWKPTVDLDDGLGRTIDYFRKLMA